MNSSIKRGLVVGLVFAFLVMGFVTMQRAMPEAKEERIYKELKVYMPYRLEKTVGGLAIIDKRDGRKETPSAAEVMLRLDDLEKQWGKQHLKILGDQVIILDDINQSVMKIFIETEKEHAFLKQFFGI